MTVSNSAGKLKLKYDGIQDLILVEEERMRDYGDIFYLGFALNVDTWGQGHDMYSIIGRSKSRNNGRRSQSLGNKVLVGIVVRRITSKEIIKIQRRLRKYRMF